MNVNFYLSNLNMVAKSRAFRDIAKLRNTNKIIILTPDRNTLNIERELLRSINEKSVFNVNVVTFSRLAKAYLTEKGLYRNVLTKHASIALIKKILLEVKSDLRVFQKNIDQIGFCEKIFETICLYKSCKILPQEFYITDKEDLLMHKLHDIKLIYEKYESYFDGEFVDSFYQLDLFEQSLTKEDYNDVHFYLMDYEDITPAISRVVAKLAKYAKSFNICTTYSKSVGGVNNANLHTNEIYYNLVSRFDMAGVCYNNIYVDAEDHDVAVLGKNIFGTKVQDVQVKNRSLKLIKANSVDDEVMAVCTEIKRNLLDGKYLLKDVSLVVSDLTKYRQVLQKTLNKLDIPYYIDETEKLDSNILTKVMLWIMEIASEGVDKYSIIKLIDSGILKIPMKSINAYKAYVYRIDARGKYLYTIPDKIDASDELMVAVNTVKELVDNIAFSENTLLGYKETLDNILQSLKFSEYYELLYNRYVEEKDVVSAKKLKQTYNKLSDMWTELVMLFRNEEVELKDFVSIFKAFVADIPLSLPPIKVDCLVVNDFDNSYVDSCEYMYIIGANDSELPKYSVETALLSDKEIQKIERHNKITPTINLLNKRKKFKLYEMVLKSRHNITFSYVCVDAKGEEVYPTTIYTEIAKYIKPYVYVVDNAYVLDSDANELITYNITKSLAMDNVVKYLKDWELFNDDQVYRRNVTSIQHSLSGEDDIDIIGNANYDNVAMPVAKANKLFFRNDEVSPSQFEKFASCPYAHFMNYGLRLKEQERAKVSTNDIGNIIHEYLNNVIYDLSNLKNDEEFLTALEDFARKSLDKVLDNKRYARFVNANINSIVIKSLYNEVIRMTKAIIEQLRNCDYEPTYKEYVLNVKNGGYIAISLRNGKRLNVVGKVDRIDTNKKDNSFIVIDYKTGNSNFANFTDFVSGKKIQLFTYLLMFKNMTGATPVGSFYLPIDNKVNDAKKYRYNGFFVKNIETVGNIDNKLRDFSSNGEILRLSRTKDGEFSQKSDVWKNLAISSKAIENSFDFLTDALTCRAEKIMEGNIDLVPLLTGNDSACKYCKFKGLCNFNTKYGNKYRRVEKVASLKEIIDVNESYESVEEEEDV